METRYYKIPGQVRIECRCIAHYSIPQPPGTEQKAVLAAFDPANDPAHLAMEDQRRAHAAALEEHPDTIAIKDAYELLATDFVVELKADDHEALKQSPEMAGAVELTVKQVNDLIATEKSRLDAIAAEEAVAVDEVP